MVDFNTFRKKSSSSFERLSKEMEKLSTGRGEYTEDPRFWQPTVDNSGNGYAVIRFLPEPAVDGDDAYPWVRVFTHNFQGPTGQWYIENSLFTINREDPVMQVNKKLWDSTTDDKSPAREQARKQKRKLAYVSNILVVDDPANPANNGKVFLYRYGKKIFDKINEKMHPKFPDEKPVNPFDFETGAHFKLKIRQVEGYRNYDSSSFAESAPLSTDMAYLENMWKSEHSLKQFIDPNGKDHEGRPLFKSYEELKKKLDSVLGVAERQEVSSRPVTKDTPPWEDEETVVVSRGVTESTPKIQAVVDDEDDELASLRELISK